MATRATGVCRQAWLGLILVCVSWTCSCAVSLGARVPVGAQGNRVASHSTAKALTLAASVAKRGAAKTTDAYVVQEGDTLWRIAYNHKIPLETVAALNNITTPQQLRAGARLQMPSSGAPAPARVAKLDSRDTLREKKSENETDSEINGGVVSRGLSRSETRIETIQPTKYPLRWPLDGVITSRFGQRSGRTHDGIDIGAPRGADVHAAADGEVLFSARHGGYGNLVVLRHNNGLVTVYAHHDVNLVQKGERVTQGQSIARVGATGRASGPHLHFEVRRGTLPENPLTFLPP